MGSIVIVFLLLSVFLASITLVLLRKGAERSSLLFNWTSTLFATFIGVVAAALLSVQSISITEKAVLKDRIRITGNELNTVRERVLGHPAFLIDDNTFIPNLIDDNLPSRIFSLELLLSDPALAEYAPVPMTELLRSRQNLELAQNAIERPDRSFIFRRNALVFLGHELRNTSIVLENTL